LSGLFEAHHHRPSLIAGSVVILPSGKLYGRRCEGAEHAYCGNKSHVTSYLYPTAWNGSRVKKGGSWLRRL